MSRERTIDVLGLGCAAVDDLLYVEQYPPADAKTRVLHRERQCGGLTATALVTAARLGARCAYAAVLGHDELSRFVLEALAREGIDVTHVVRRRAARPIYSVVVIDAGRRTRNIFFDLEGVVGADEVLPSADVIRSAQVLFVDHIGVAGMVRAAQIARGDRIPVVADFEGDESPRFPELLQLVDHLILSHDFATRISGEADPAAATSALWTQERQVVIVTCGREGCWYLTGSDGGRPQHHPAYPVRAVDTVGCGDVFHGAYAAALARGLDLTERVRVASAAAALKAVQRGGQAGIPVRSAVDTFLEEDRQ